jgi:hypothetical protein
VNYQIIKKYSHFFALLLLIVSSFSFAKTQKIIIDGDLGADPCDFATISMAYNMHNNDEIEILALMMPIPDDIATQNLSILDALYNRKDKPIPIGVFKNKSDPLYQTMLDGVNNVVHAKPAAKVINKIHNDLVSTNIDSAWGGVSLYRKLLSEQEDGSVTLLFEGQLGLLLGLLQSEADEYSPLSGIDLINKKVDKIVSMIGTFPNILEWRKVAQLPHYVFGPFPNINIWIVLSMLPIPVDYPEYNARNFGAASITHEAFGLLEKISKDIPITLVDYEVGLLIPTGEAYIDLEKTDPVYLSFVNNNTFSKEYGAVFGEVPRNNPAFDEAALLYAVRGPMDYFDVVQGRVNFDIKGVSKWTASEDIQGDNARHLRVLVKKGANDGQKLSGYIENMVMNPDYKVKTLSP